MVSINWFEVGLPSTEFVIFVEDSKTSLGKKIKSIKHRTVKYQEEIFHISSQKVENSREQVINRYDLPKIISYAIEHGFCEKLDSLGFEVIISHVGARAFFKTKSSPMPDIFELSRGINFRCFYGFGYQKSLRWGLILNYQTSQHFTISLQDDLLRELARTSNSPVVSINKTEGQPASGFLKSVNETNLTGKLEYKDGEIEIDLKDWTIPGNVHNLLSYISKKYGSTRASSISNEIQKMDFRLTSSGRMNTSLAKDQFKALDQILSEFNLYTFNLALPNQPSARINRIPLRVEGNQ